MLVKKKEEYQRLNGILKAKEIQSVKDRIMDQEKRKKRKCIDEFSVNIWNTDSK